VRQVCGALAGAGVAPQSSPRDDPPPSRSGAAPAEPAASRWDWRAQTRRAAGSAGG